MKAIVIYDISIDSIEKKKNFMIPVDVFNKGLNDMYRMFNKVFSRKPKVKLGRFSISTN